MDRSLICIELLFCQSFKKWGSNWDEKPEFYSIKYVGFFLRLNHFGDFYPIDKILDISYINSNLIYF